MMLEPGFSNTVVRVETTSNAHASPTTHAPAAMLNARRRKCVKSPSLTRAEVQAECGEIALQAPQHVE
jgi:hypothetical protein